MSAASLRIMVDTNVWVDSFCCDHRESVAARAFITRASEVGARLFFPVHIAKDVLYVIRHELKRAALAEAGCECAFFTAKDYSSAGGNLKREDAGKLAALALGTVVGMAWKGEEKDG